MIQELDRFFESFAVISTLEYAYQEDSLQSLLFTEGAPVKNLRSLLREPNKGCTRFETYWIGSEVIYNISKSGFTIMIDPYDEEFVTVTIYPRYS